MAKWADFCIVRKHTVNGVMDRFECYPDKGEELGFAFVLYREEVIYRIDSREHSFCTAKRNENGKLTKGEDVRTRKSSSGKKYLRTDNNETDADNLGNLPEF